MAKIINSLQLKRLARIRDNALSAIGFHDSYLAIARDLAAHKRERAVRQKELRMKRRLLPLEKKAASKRELAIHRMETRLDALKEKQRLPRLAVEQTYIRKSRKQGEDAAQAYRDKALKRLDKAVQKVRFEGEKEIAGSNTECSAEIAERYQKELKLQTARLNAFKAALEQRTMQKLEGLEANTKRKNDALQQRADACSARLAKLGDATHKAMHHSDTVLEVNGLVMKFGGLKAVDDLTFSVKEGEIFGLIGPNGAGKTTVFNCVTQFNKPTAGTIYYRNRSGDVVNLCHRKVHGVIGTGIVRTFQNVELIWELSVLDNMLIGAHSLYHASFLDHVLHTPKLRREEQVMKQRALDVLERLDLLQYKDVVPYGLPYGILKKIELARTLMVHPRLIILDEPAAGLNDSETEELAETICRIRDDYRCTVFLVEHDMGLVMNICDTVCAISFGKMLAMGTPHDIQTNEIVQEAYLGGTMGEAEDE